MSKKLVKLGATIFLIITLFSQVCIPFIYADEGKGSDYEN